MRYRLVLECDINKDGKTELIEFDNCKTKKSSSSSRLPEHPLQNGSILVDHSYREPVKMTVSGVYSLNGYYTMQNGIHDPYKTLSNKMAEQSTQFNFNNDELYGVNRLGYIQNVIEYIKNNGLLCSLTTMADGDGSIMFKRRENMAIENIDWDEQYNSMNFNIQFKEIMQVAIPQYETISYSDLYPDVYMPEAQSLTQVLSNGDNSIIARAVMRKLLDEGYIDKDNQNYIATRGKDYWEEFSLEFAAFSAVGFAIIAICGIVAATSAAVAAGAAAVIGATAAIFPVGTIIAVAAAAIGACVWAGITISKNRKKRNDLKGVYNLIKDTNAEMSELNINTDNVNKVNALLEKTTEILATKLANNVTVYSLSSGTENNKDRTICLTIGDSIYYFQAFQNNNEWQFTLQQKTDTETTQVSRANFSITDLWSATQPNALFVDYKNSIEVYVINPSLTEIVNPSQEKQDAAKKYLCSYYLVISKGKLESTMKELNNAILDATVSAFEEISV